MIYSQSCYQTYRLELKNEEAMGSSLAITNSTECIIIVHDEMRHFKRVHLPVSKTVDIDPKVLFRVTWKTLEIPCKTLESPSKTKEGWPISFLPGRTEIYTCLTYL